MNAKEAAAALDGSEYRDADDHALFAQMKAEGLVAVFGASDDLMEFRGAIDDEVGCFGGGTAHLTSAGLLHNDCENDDCPSYKRHKETAAVVAAIWGDGDISWHYETDIPHEPFIVRKDGEDYCRGIVFRLVDVR